MDDSQSKALEEFLLDIDCLKKLDEWKDTFNLFDVLKITHTEIRHSNILGWLLDSNGNHHLGDSFFKAFIKDLVQSNNFEYELSITLMTQNLYSFSVLREFNHIDLTLISEEEKTIYVIENKVFARESNNQLQRYENKIEEEFSDYKNKIYIYLTPEGDESSEPNIWHSLSYESLINSIEEIMKDSAVNEDVKSFINNFIYSVRKNIMEEKDLKLISVCNEIYRQHREALNLIYQNVNIDKSEDMFIICEVLKKYSNEGKIILENENSLSFWTKRMNEYLPEIENENSSWKTKHIYYYWLQKEEDKIIIHLEIGGKIGDEYIPENSEIYNKFINLIQVSKKLKNSVKDKIPFTYKRLYKGTIKISEKDDIAAKVSQLIDNALKNEENLLSEVEK